MCFSYYVQAFVYPVGSNQIIEFVLVSSFSTCLESCTLFLCPLWCSRADFRIFSFRWFQPCPMTFGCFNARWWLDSGKTHISTDNHHFLWLKSPFLMAKSTIHGPFFNRCSEKKNLWDGWNGPIALAWQAACSVLPRNDDGDDTVFLEQKWIRIHHK